MPSSLESGVEELARTNQDLFAALSPPNPPVCGDLSCTDECSYDQIDLGFQDSRTADIDRKDPVLGEENLT